MTMFAGPRNRTVNARLLGWMLYQLSCIMRKPAFCMCQNKGKDQLRSYADLCPWFHFIDSTIYLLPKSEISRLWPSSVAVQFILCRTWSETPKTGFLMMAQLYCRALVFNHINMEIDFGTHEPWKLSKKEWPWKNFMTNLNEKCLLDMGSTYMHSG